MLVGIAALAIFLVGAFLDRAQFFRSYLYAYVFFTGLALGSLGIVLMHNVVGGNWGVAIRRIVESGARTLPLMLILLIPVLAGIHSLYIWSDPNVAANDANIRLKASYLNVPFFIIRAVGYFVIWIFFSMVIDRKSAQQDATPDHDEQRALMIRMRQFSAPSLVVFVLTATFAFIDWIMSLEPHWFSTIYGAMFLIGQVLQAFAFSVVLLFLLSRSEPFVRALKIQHFWDLGNLILAFTMLWAYLSFSQFLIIWSGNLPEEIPWYIRRFSGGWGFIALLLCLFHFAVPFFLLLMRFVKKNPSLLWKVAIGIIVIRILDVFWIVEPSLYPKGFALHWMDIVAPFAIGGLWLAFFLWNFKSRPLLPIHDPRLGYHPFEVEI